MYGPKTKRPSLLPAGSAGYAPKYLTSGVWQKEADRFAGAILLGEILSWCSEEVRNKNGRMQVTLKRKKCRQNVKDIRYFSKYYIINGTGKLQNYLSRHGVVILFAECPSFAQWYDVFNSAREIIKIDAERQSAEEHSLFVSKCLEIARLLEERI